MIMITYGRASLGEKDCQEGKTSSGLWKGCLHPTSWRGHHHSSQKSTQSASVRGHSGASSSKCRNPPFPCTRNPPGLKSMGTQYGIVLKANQQVSKVEEEGDDDRDEGPAGTEQDEVGGKNLICKTIKQRRSSRDYVKSKVMLTTTNRVQRVDNISADDPLAGQDPSEEEEQVLDVRLPSH